MKKLLILSIGLFVATVVFASSANATLIYSTPNTLSTNGFDTLSTTVATNHTWTNNTTIPGWYLFTGAGAAIPTYRAATGSDGTGHFYSFGAAANTERALGGVGSGGAYFGTPSTGAVAGYIAVGYENRTGQTLEDFAVKYDGEQWRNGGNTTAHTMVFEYGIGGSTFGSVSNWIAPGGSFDWTSVVNTATAAAVDGNTTGLVAGRGGAVSGITWNNGDFLWMRWIERNDSGLDHGMGIDSFEFSAMPEPSSLLTVLGATIVGCFRRRRAV